jgi:hypothetical protein
MGMPQPMHQLMHMALLKVFRVRRLQQCHEIIYVFTTFILLEFKFFFFLTSFIVTSYLYVLPRLKKLCMN